MLTEEIGANMSKSKNVCDEFSENPQFLCSFYSPNYFLQTIAREDHYFFAVDQKVSEKKVMPILQAWANYCNCRTPFNLIDVWLNVSFKLIRCL
jgi:hypothetical protein